MILTQPNDYTQVSTDSDLSANASSLDFKINFGGTQKAVKTDNDAQREIFAD